MLMQFLLGFGSSGISLRIPSYLFGNLYSIMFKIIVVLYFPRFSRELILLIVHILIPLCNFSFSRSVTGFREAGGILDLEL